jgi:hypothetical protein
MQRLASGRKMLGLARRYLRERLIPRATRLRILEAATMAAATYGAETWTMTQSDRARLDALHKQGLRIITGLHHTVTIVDGQKEFHRTPSAVLYERAGAVPASSTVDAKREAFTCRLHLQSPNLPERQVLNIAIEGGTGNGRQTWLESTRADLPDRTGVAPVLPKKPSKAARKKRSTDDKRDLARARAHDVFLTAAEDRGAEALVSAEPVRALEEDESPEAYLASCPIALPQHVQLVVPNENGEVAPEPSDDEDDQLVEEQPAQPTTPLTPPAKPPTNSTKLLEFPPTEDRKLRHIEVVVIGDHSSTTCPVKACKFAGKCLSSHLLKKHPNWKWSVSRTTQCPTCQGTRRRSGKCDHSRNLDDILSAAPQHLAPPGTIPTTNIPEPQFDFRRSAAPPKPILTQTLLAPITKARKPLPEAAATPAPTKPASPQPQLKQLLLAPLPKAQAPHPPAAEPPTKKPESQHRFRRTATRPQPTLSQQPPAPHAKTRASRPCAAAPTAKPKPQAPAPSPAQQRLPTTPAPRQLSLTEAFSRARKALQQHGPQNAAASPASEAPTTAQQPAASATAPTAPAPTADTADTAPAARAVPPSPVTATSSTPHRTAAHALTQQL